MGGGGVEGITFPFESTTLPSPLRWTNSSFPDNWPPFDENPSIGTLYFQAYMEICADILHLGKFTHVANHSHLSSFVNL